MARITAARRKQLPKSKFAIPEKAPGPGSYPIDTPGRASAALRFSKGQPERARVVRAVCSAWPDLPFCVALKKGGSGSSK